MEKDPYANGMQMIVFGLVFLLFYFVLKSKKNEPKGK